MQLLDLCGKGKDSQEKVTGCRFSQLGRQRVTLWGHLCIFNTKENLRELGKHKGLLTKFRIKKRDVRASLVAQWLGVRLPMQGTRV